MKSSIKKLSQSIVELTIEESKENISKYRTKVLNDLRKTGTIKGFRKGSDIPDDIIVKHYGEEKISTLMIDESLNKLYSQALKENQILPVAQGEIKEIQSQDPLIVIMHIEVFPEVEINGDYRKIQLPKTNINVSDEDVEKALSDIQKKFTKFEVSESGYAAQKGDKVYISTQGYDLDGNILENTNMEQYPLVLGSNLLVPGFEEKLEGVTADSEISLDIKFPEDYHNNDFKGKETKFKVTVHKIEKAIIPEFTEKFIKDLRGKDLDLVGFKQLIKEELIEVKENNARLEDENKLIDELLNYAVVDFGPHLFKNQVQKVYEEIKNNIVQSGAKVLDYIESLGLTETAYIEQNVHPVATRRLQAELILHKLGELEAIDVSNDDLETEINKIISKFGSDEVVARLKELYVPGTKYYEELKQRMRYRNIIDSFFA